MTTTILPRRPTAGSSTSTTTPSLSHAFSTTTRNPATAASGGARPGVHQRGGKQMQLSKFKKTKDLARGRSPLPGERRATRKRIVLSNNNALRVDGAPRMDGANLADAASGGLVMKVPEGAIDQLRLVEAFKSSQTWGLFHSPHMLVRPETVTVCARMLAAAEAGETARMVVAGEKAAGKSMVLLQAMTNAFLNDWVVINIPEGMLAIYLSPELPRCFKSADAKQSDI